MMLLLTTAVSRLVPLLFVSSALLVAGRFLHNRYAPAHRLLGRSVLAAVLVVGLIFLFPYTARSAALVVSQYAYLRRDWERVDRLFSFYRRLGGREGEAMAGSWAAALMNLRKWREAEAVLISTTRRIGSHVQATPYTVLLLGICRYYDGRLGWAEKTLRAVPDSSDNYLRDYFLGRLAELRSDVPEAIASYERCLDKAGNLFPAVYQLVRLRLLREENDKAAEALSRFPGFQSDSHAGMRELAEAVAGGRPVPPPREFVIVQD